MGIFDWLLGKREPVKALAPQPAATDVDFDDMFVSVKSIAFWGHFRRSKAKNWAVAWRDSADRANGGGNRESGPGRFVLIDLETSLVRYQGHMPRPNNGAVANNGTFSIEDWEFGNALSGTFWVIQPDGNPIVSKKLTANILESGISKNGLLAFCTTANSRTEDGFKLFLFDLSNGRELFCVTPQRFRVDGYTFDEKKIELIAKITGGGEYRYRASGALLDPEEADDAFLHSNDYVAILMTAQKHLKSPASLVDGADVLAAVIRARSLGADANPAWRPTAAKVQGLAHDALDQHLEAMQCYEEAISLDPKIGVKRRLDALKKKV